MHFTLRKLQTQISFPFKNSFGSSPKWPQGAINRAHKDSLIRAKVDPERTAVESASSGSLHVASQPIATKLFQFSQNEARARVRRSRRF